VAAYARLCHLRLGPDAQKEIRIVAGEVAQQLKSKFPVSWSALSPPAPS
jgi:thymidylate synthase ThyX